MTFERCRGRPSVDRSFLRSVYEECLENKKAVENQRLKIGWGTWTRTKTNGVRVRCSTIKLFPNE